MTKLRGALSQIQGRFETEEAPRPKRPRPGLTHDNRFFFEGAKEHQLLIQRCAMCQALRHPPQPRCDKCGSYEWDTRQSRGRGVVYSFVVNHYPQVPAFDYPLLVALVELDEGIRMVSNVVDVDPADVRIGMALEVGFEPRGADAAVPVFRPAPESPGAV